MRRLSLDPGDLVGGVSAAFVLIPQALAYATLAGMPPERGLYVAALAPLAAALLASSPYLGTGPTAITSLLTFGALSPLAPVASPHYVALAALLALLVGVIRVILGLGRVGYVAYLISQPILTGFTTGAAVVIVASQVATVLGLPSHDANPLLGAFRALSHPADWQPAALLLALGAGLVMVGGRRIHRLFPGLLVAMGAAIVYVSTVGYGGEMVGEIAGGLPVLSLHLPWAELPRLVVPAIVIAVVGFSEPASIARHYATVERRRWDPHREFISQGMANLAAGLGGGFPAGGSFTRSALVRESGARTRLSGGLTGLVVLLLLPFMSLLARLPTAVLGASIMVAVRGMITLEPFRRYRRYTRLQFRVALFTLALTVLLAPHVERAVVLGIVVGVGAHLWREMRLGISSWVLEDVLHVAPRGVLYFGSAPLLDDAFRELLGERPDVRRVVLHLDGLGRIDVTGALALRDLLGDLRRAGLEAEVVDVPPHARKIVARVVDAARQNETYDAREG